MSEKPMWTEIVSMCINSLEQNDKQKKDEARKLLEDMAQGLDWYQERERTAIKKTAKSNSTNKVSYIYLPADYADKEVTILLPKQPQPDTAEITM